MTRPITLTLLREKSVCAEALERFKTLFGDSVTPTRELCIAHAGDFDLLWAARHLLSPSARRAYDVALAPAREAYHTALASAGEAYRTALAPAWEAYRAALAPAGEAYRAGRAPAWEAYCAATASAWEAYDDATASAWEAYDAATASAFFDAWDNHRSPVAK